MRPGCGCRHPGPAAPGSRTGLPPIRSTIRSSISKRFFNRQVITVRPHMAAGHGIDQVGGDAQAVAVPAVRCRSGHGAHSVLHGSVPVHRRGRETRLTKWRQSPADLRPWPASCASLPPRALTSQDWPESGLMSRKGSTATGSLGWTRSAALLEYQNSAGYQGYNRHAPQQHSYRTAFQVVSPGQEGGHRYAGNEHRHGQPGYPLRETQCVLHGQQNFSAAPGNGNIDRERLKHAFVQ